MGVLACDRRDCEHIMCDRYSDVYGYICDTDFEELVANGIVDIDTFMNTPPNGAETGKAVRAYYDEIFKPRQD